MTPFVTQLSAKGYLNMPKIINVDEDLTLTDSELKDVLAIRAEVVSFCRKRMATSSDIELAELEGMIDAIKEMYNPIDFGSEEKWH